MDARVEAWLDNGAGAYIPKPLSASGKELEYVNLINNENGMSVTVNNVTDEEFEIYGYLLQKFGYIIDKQEQNYIGATGDRFNVIVLYQSKQNSMLITCKPIK